MLRVRTPFRVSGASVIAHAPVSGVPTEGSEAPDIAMRGELRDHPRSASRQGAQKGRRDPARQAARRAQSPARGARLGRGTNYKWHNKDQKVTKIRTSSFVPFFRLHFAFCVPVSVLV